MLASTLPSGIWAEPFDIRDLRRHDDPRGGLFEILRFTEQCVPGGGQLYTFTINPGQRRGDHYHTRKREWFTCAHGKAVVLLTDTKTGREESVELDAAKPKIVYAGPHTAHALLNREPETAVIISYGSEEHHPEDPDTILHRCAEWPPG
jgi:dTDP-4-dehydrorhamnose 3,5-epimerase-like enzyme